MLLLLLLPLSLLLLLSLHMLLSPVWSSRCLSLARLASDNHWRPLAAVMSRNAYRYYTIRELKPSELRLCLTPSPYYKFKTNAIPTVSNSAVRSRGHSSALPRETSRTAEGEPACITAYSCLTNLHGTIECKSLFIIGSSATSFRLRACREKMAEAAGKPPARSSLHYLTRAATANTNRNRAIASQRIVGNLK